MSEWEQFLALIPDDGCATPASEQLLAVAQEVTGA